MKDIKRCFNVVTIGTIILDLIFIILGIFLIANPTVGVDSALMLFGIILLVTGIYSIVKYIMNNQSFFRFELVYGLLSIIVGCFAIFKPFTIVNLITVLLGIWLIISSVFKFGTAIELRKINEDTWTFDLAISALTILLGIMLIINPFSGYMVISTYTGILIMIYAMMDFVEQLFIRKRASRILKYFK